MISQNNYIYTDNGILSINELYTKSIDTTVGVIKPKIMSFNPDINNISYFFTDEYIITMYDNENTYKDVYECKFLDGFSNRTVTVNCTSDVSILQYNILVTDKSTLINKNIQVLRYLVDNKTRTKLNLGWKKLSDLYNYATKMHNICLGDNILKFTSKLYKQKEITYGINIPYFTTSTLSTFYNFVLMKDLIGE